MRRDEGRVGSREFAVIRALVRPVCRTLPWTALLAGGGLGLLLAGLPRLLSDAPAPEVCLPLLRAAALCFALGLAFLLDDPARHLTTPVPTRRPVRSALRLALVAPVAALWWTAALLLVPGQARPPVGALTLEAGACAALALAAAATVVRFTDEAGPGLAVAIGLLTAAIAVPLLLPVDWTLLAVPGDPYWDASHGRWAAVLGVAVAVGVACVPEPLRRRAVGFRGGTAAVR